MLSKIQIAFAIILVSAVGCLGLYFIIDDYDVGSNVPADDGSFNFDFPAEAGVGSILKYDYVREFTTVKGNDSSSYTETGTYTYTIISADEDTITFKSSVVYRMDGRDEVKEDLPFTDTFYRDRNQDPNDYFDDKITVEPGVTKCETKWGSRDSTAINYWDHVSTPAGYTSIGADVFKGIDNGLIYSVDYRSTSYDNGLFLGYSMTQYDKTSYDLVEVRFNPYSP